MNFVGKGIKLSSADITLAGRRIGVSEDEIHAILDVETSGSGFDHLGRPMMLFEPHIFYKKVPQDKQWDAVKQGLAYANYGSQPYPKDSYPRLIAAMVIDSEAALQSASFGIGQILGSNYKAAGYHSATEMVTAFIDSEAVQLTAMINFIFYNNLDGYLRNHDWAGFAKGYNGVSFKTNKYDTKLAASFAKWSKIKDTPLEASQKPAEPVSVPQAAPITSKTETPPVTTVAAPAAVSLWDRIKTLLHL